MVEQLKTFYAYTILITYIINRNNCMQKCSGSLRLFKLYPELFLEIKDFLNYT